MTRIRGALRALAGVGAVVAFGVAAPPGQAASAQGAAAEISVPATPGQATSEQAAAGQAGYCKDDTGVTVVVDMSSLGGDIVVRCDPSPVGAGDTGIEALQDVGFTVTGTQRYGLSFVCRISGRPAADEALAVPGDPDYHEKCVDTPPQTAFWAYWSAPNGGKWTYGSVGASTHQPISGGFEGWAFSLGNSDGSAAAPGIDPTRPGSLEPPTTTPPPSTQPSPPHHHGGSSHPNSPTSSPPPPAPPTSSEPTSQDTAPPSTTPAASAPPTDAGRPGKHHHHDKSGGAPPPPPPTTGEAGPAAPATGTSDTGVRVTGDLPDTADSSASSSRATLIGVGVLAVLGIGIGWTAWRRTHRP